MSQAPDIDPASEQSPPTGFDLEDARDKVRAGLGRLLDACDGLLDLASGLNPWPGRPIDPYARPHEPLLVAVFSRSINTYASVIELVRVGFGEQAAMLNRPLFEEMIDAHWITLNPRLALDRFRDHHTHGRMLFADAARSTPGFVSEEDVPGFDPTERERLDRLFGRYGSRSWTGVSLHARVAAIGRLWGERREALEFHWRIVHRDNNQQLHLSGLAMNQMVVRADGGGLHVKLGPGPEYLTRALASAFWTFGEMLGLMLDYFEIAAQEDFDRVYGAGAEAFADGTDLLS